MIRRDDIDMPKILGLYSAIDDEWYKLAYLHGTLNDKSFVNGKEMRISAVCAGSPMPRDAEFVIILPKGTDVHDERFFSCGGGECLLWNDGGAYSIASAGFICVSSEFEIWRQINAAVLTISDKASRGERVDTAGPALADMASALGCSVIKRKTVPDSIEMIASAMKEWADAGDVQLILSTGGTGLSKRDVTPEALASIADKHVPGFGETMRRRSMSFTERGFLSRGSAAVRASSLIITFPGSENAVRQCFDAIAGGLRHAVEILNGWDAECGGHHHRH